MSKDKMDIDYTNLLEIDTFRVVKDTKYDALAGHNNLTEHWIAHVCEDYLDNKEPESEPTGAFSADEIKDGACYYCKQRIPEPIMALWSMLEWDHAADVLYPENEQYPIMSGTL